MRLSGLGDDSYAKLDFADEVASGVGWYLDAPNGMLQTSFAHGYPQALLSKSFGP